MGFLDIVSGNYTFCPPGGWNVHFNKQEIIRAENEWLWLVKTLKLDSNKAIFIVLNKLYESHWH